jgi:hypothetical protein
MRTPVNEHKILILLLAITLLLGIAASASRAQEEEDSGTLRGDWCSTFEAFAAKHPEMLMSRDGECPIMGDCDIAANRDAMIPDASSPIITIRLKFNVLCEDDGSNPAASQSDVDTQLATLNTAYAPFHVQFVAETEFINDSENRYVAKAEFDDLKTAHADDPAHQCNIFVTTVNEATSQGSFPWDPDALTATGGVVMHSGHFTPTDDVLAHEIGHNFGLWHTHHGVSENPGPQSTCDWGCYEHAGTPSDETGDMCSDTPPTPVNHSCSDPGGSDACTPDEDWGETWPENYMSYGGPGCWAEFSDQQMGRMRCWIDAMLMDWAEVEPQPPVAMCTDVTVSADENCEADASIDAGSNDPDGGVVTLQQDPPGPYPLGETYCILTVTDDEGETDICDATVTVVDDTPPQIDCPPDITVGNDPDQCSAVVNFSIGATDNCPGVSVQATPPSGSVFPVGSTAVTVSATDASGNTASCTFNVTVQDIQAPVATCPGDITVGNDPDQCSAVVNFTYSATDNCPGVGVDASIASGSTFPVGTTVVTVTATDATGNVDDCTFNVTVEDVQAPVVSCPDSIAVNFSSPNEAVAEFEATATDNCEEEPTVWCEPSSGSTFPIGNNLVQCFAADSAGNQDTCEFSFDLVYLDVKPRSCPNALNVKPYIYSALSMKAASDGLDEYPVEDVGDGRPEALLPVAILGTEDMDVKNILIESIRLNGESPVSHSYEDVAAPAVAEDEYCSCTKMGPDGFTDLSLKFSLTEIIETLGPVTDGEFVQLIVTGTSNNLTPIFGGDCVLIRAPRVTDPTPLVKVHTPSTGLVGANPNPFNPTTTISFNLSQTATYTISICNIAGQVVETFSGAGQSGLNTVIWNGSAYASGIYFYRLDALGVTDTKKMVLVK